MSKLFGALPSGDRLARVKASLQYKGGKFANERITPDFTEDANMWKVLKAFRRKPSTTKPGSALQTVKSNKIAIGKMELRTTFAARKRPGARCGTPVITYTKKRT